jgi:hypothetical protein
MSRAGAPIVWLSKYALRLHAMLFVGLGLCVFASWAEWTRALEGHPVAWVYAFEWPLFAVLGSGMWWRLLRAEYRNGESRPPRRQRRPSAVAIDDPQLVAWQDYLARLHAEDPPGGPPL